MFISQSNCWFCHFLLPIMWLFPFLSLSSNYADIMSIFRWFSSSSLSFCTTMLWCYPVSWVITTFYHGYKCLHPVFLFTLRSIGLLLLLWPFTLFCTLFISPLLPILLLLSKTSWVAFISKSHESTRLVSTFLFFIIFQ